MNGIQEKRKQKIRHTRGARRRLIGGPSKLRGRTILAAPIPARGALVHRYPGLPTTETKGPHRWQRTFGIADLDSLGALL